MEIKYILFAAAFLIIAIWCWCGYNSGTGGSLGSLKKITILGICVCFSILTMLSTSSGVNGSKYNLSAISKSVLTVSGLLLMMIVS